MKSNELQHLFILEIIFFTKTFLYFHVMYFVFPLPYLLQISVLLLPLVSAITTGLRGVK